MFGRRPKEMPPLHKFNLPDEARPAVDLLAKQNEWTNMLVGDDTRLASLRFLGGPQERAALATKELPVLTDQIHALLRKKLRALADALYKIAPSSEDSGLRDLNRIAFLNGDDTHVERYNPTTGELISEPPPKLTDKQISPRLKAVEAAKTAATVVKSNFTDERIAVIEGQFQEFGILLTAAESIDRILGPKTEKSQFCPLPLQITAAEQCLAEFNYFALEQNDDTRRQFLEAFDRMRLMLNIKDLAANCRREIGRRLNKLKTDLAASVTKSAGLIAKARGRRVASAEKLLPQIAHKFQDAQVAFLGVQEELEEYSEILNGDPDADGLNIVGVIQQFDFDSVGDKEFNELAAVKNFNDVMAELDKLVNQLKESLKTKDEKIMLAPTRSGEAATVDMTEPTESRLTPEAAREIMGGDYLGPEAVEKTFGVKLEAGEIPPIPFTTAELARAEELGQFLILRVNRAPDNAPLTMEKMNALLADKFKKAKKGKVLYNTDWYNSEEFYRNDTCKSRWALVSKGLVPNSTSKDYLQQTEILTEYVKNQVFAGTALPAEYQTAIAELENKKDQLRQLISNDWQKAAIELSKLKINQLTRQDPTEVLYDLLVYFQQNARLLENRYTWTLRLSSVGRLVLVGGFDVDGAGVRGGGPGDASGYLGVSFARSL